MQQPQPKYIYKRLQEVTMVTQRKRVGHSELEFLIRTATCCNLL